MKKTIIILSILLTSCSSDELDKCDCVKLTYIEENYMYFNEIGFPRRSTTIIELNREYVCDEPVERVYVGRNDTNYHNIYYDITCD